MKVLILAPYPPYPPRGGGQQRMYQVIRQLAAQHTLHLVTFSPDMQATAELDALRPLCRLTTVPAPIRTRSQRVRTALLSTRPDMLWRGYAKTFGQTVREVLQGESYDVVQAESIEMTQYAPRGAVTRANEGPLWVYDSWNVEYTIQRRAFLTDAGNPRQWPRAGYSLLQWSKLRRYEHGLHRTFAGSFAVSEGDQALLQQLDPQLPVTVVPNGVDTSYFAPRGMTPAGLKVLFTGTLDYRANVDALRWFVATVWPRIVARVPAARLRIVGRKPGQEIRKLADGPLIEVCADVADVRPFFAEARVYVVPMRIGGGVRLKVLEAFAQGVPVVSTTLGVDGIAGFLPDIHGIVADEPEGFAQAVVQLFEHPERAATLAHAARALVVQRYDWTAIVPRMATAWEEWQAKALLVQHGI